MHGRRGLGAGRGGERASSCGWLVRSEISWEGLEVGASVPLAFDEMRWFEEQRGGSFIDISPGRIVLGGGGSVAHRGLFP